MKTKRTARSSANTAETLHIFNALNPIEHRAIDTLKNYTRGLRKHPEKQLVKLAASIREFGFVVPALVAADGTLITGEARVAAARRTGLKTVPTIRIDHLSADQQRAYRLADNRLGDLADWDRALLKEEFGELLMLDEFNLEALGWETSEIDLLMDEDMDQPEADAADAIIQPPVTPVSRVGDIWMLNQHRLACGSSLNAATWKAILDGAEAAMSFSDPPFNVPVNGHVSGLGKTKHAEFLMASGEMSRPEFTNFLTDYLNAMMLHVRDGGLCQSNWRHPPLSR